MAKTNSNGSSLNAHNLKEALWNTLCQARDGSIDPAAAKVVASNAREILRCVSLEIQMAQLNTGVISKTTKAFTDGG